MKVERMPERGGGADAVAGGGRATASWYAGLAAVLAVAAWLRLAGFADVLQRGEVLPLDGDAAYHLRRTLATVPTLWPPTFDRALAWPAGGHVPWSAGFDQLGAAFVRLVGGGPLAPTLDPIAVAFLPVVLGLVAVHAATVLARLLLPSTPGGRAAALVSGLFAAVSPTAVAFSRFGATDHHVAEMVAMGWLAAWAVSGTDRLIARRATWELAGGVAAGFAMWVFTGSVLFVALVAAVISLGRLTEGLGPGAEPSGSGAQGVRSWLPGSGAPAIALAAGITALSYHPAVAEHGRAITFQLPSYLQVVLLLSLAAGCGSASYLARRIAPAATPARTFGLRLAALGAVTAAVGVAVAAAVPGAAAQVLDGLASWLAAKDPWLARVAEFQGLFASEWGRPEGFLPRLDRHWGVAGPAALLLIPAGLAHGLRLDPRRGAALLGLTAVLLGLVINQVRFDRPLLVLLAAVIGLGVHAAAQLAARWAPRAGRPLVLGGAALVLLVEPGTVGRFRPEPVHLGGIREAALFLREEPARRREGEGIGVLAPWDFGHLVLGTSGRPVAASGFGTYTDAERFRAVARALHGDETQIVALMDASDLGFLVAGAVTLEGRIRGPRRATPFAPGPDGRGVLDGTYLATVPTASLLVGGSGVPATGTPHLPHLLARFASEATVPGLAFPLPEAWVYERVQGAVLAGGGPAGAEVVAELPMMARGWTTTYAATGRVDPAGRYSIVVPLPSRWREPSISTGQAWTVRVGGGPPSVVEVGILDVRHGRTLEVDGAHATPADPTTGTGRTQAP